MLDVKMSPPPEQFLRQLEEALGAASVFADDKTRTFYANDVFWQPGIVPLAIVAPADTAGVARAVKLAAAAGVSIVPRGAGLSYTKGSLPARANALVIDLRKLNRVLEINKDDLYVTVEAGCTWLTLHDALGGTGLRPGYWGPLSGFQSTIGGALSQTSAFFGSALHGTDLSHVLGLTIVLASGEVVTTGSAGRIGTKPFTREGGPDLTALFLGDNGAFGVKVAATLKLRPQPSEIDFVSFGFPTMHEMADAQVAIARAGLVSEGFGIDRAKGEMSGSVNKFVDGAKILGDVARSGKTLLGGLKDAAAVVAGGTSFLKVHPFTLHLVLERNAPPEMQAGLSAVREIAAKTNGTEIENTMPKVLRSRPFGPLRGMLGGNGERWVPTNAIFPLSDARRVVDATDAYIADNAAMMQEHGIVKSVMAMTIGHSYFIAPAFYWMDEITPLHAATLGEDFVKPWRDRPANPRSRDAVAKLRGGCQEMYGKLGGVGWQVGRDRPYLNEILKPETWVLLQSVKSALDPAGLMNPGCLSLD